MNFSIRTRETASSIEDASMGSNEQIATVIAEHRLQCALDSMRAMLDQFVCGELLDDASQAYEAGLTSGFYGRRSSIAEASRQRIAIRFRQLHGQRKRSSYGVLLRKIKHIGTQHGSLIRSQRWGSQEHAAELQQSETQIHGVLAQLLYRRPFI